MLERPIYGQEIKGATDNLNVGKPQGPDGLNAAFYKAVKNELADLLFVVFERSFGRGIPPTSFYHGHTVVLPKSKEMDKLIKFPGYRPITPYECRLQSVNESPSETVTIYR